MTVTQIENRLRIRCGKMGDQSMEISMKDDGSSTTAGELIDALSALPRNTKVRFQGGLTLYRLKRRDDDLVQVEFNEPVFDALSYYSKAR